MHRSPTQVILMSSLQSPCLMTTSALVRVGDSGRTVLTLKMQESPTVNGMQRLGIMPRALTAVVP
jgi:hypothetical protein